MKKSAEIVKVVIFLVLYSMAIDLTACSEEDNPAASSECGSGNVTWDTKAQICRDQATNLPVPSSCCGR
ncbi:MAG: hypothetical protein HY562_11745 [Ignavibacteriales bacterium]|nr:hypothetical protein [Ignavibacteriales bacterium]